MIAIVDLTTLHLSHVEIRNFGNFTLPSVEEVCLHTIDSRAPLERIFSPQTFPALRVFAFSDQQDYIDDITELLRGLGEQLDLLWIDEDFKPHLTPDVLDRINRKTLFDRHYRLGAAFPNVHSYRLHGSENPESAPNTLEDLEEIVRTATRPLPSVFYLAGCHSLDPQDPSLEAPRQRFREVCKERNMEVVYEGAANWDVDFGRPKEFIRRMRGGREEGK